LFSEILEQNCKEEVTLVALGAYPEREKKTSDGNVQKIRFNVSFPRKREE
jgi:hypothetical protein